MTAIPATFRAFVAGQGAGAFGRRVQTFDEAELPPGEVEIRVTWSSVNYKDGLASIANGRVARIDPLIPGIDLAGEVVGSTTPDVPVGSQVIAHAYELGVSRHGGFAEYQRVPAAWIVPLPAGLTPRLSMALGTAGFTAALAVIELERRGLAPGRGPVLVTGASGGVGTVAVGILAARGHETWALTGKPDEASRLRGLGAAGILARDDAGDSPRPLESERWAGVVDTVGGATLPWALRTIASGGTLAACGNAGGAPFATTVFPFILRGVALVGINSVPVPIAERRATWERLATDLRPNGLGEGLTEVDLDRLSTALDGILAGQARGRWIVRIGDASPGAG